MLLINNRLYGSQGEWGFKTTLETLKQLFQWQEKPEYKGTSFIDRDSGVNLFS